MQLFIPDNFSDPEIRYKKEPENPERFWLILDNYFSNYQVLQIVQRDRAEINSENYKIAIRRGGASPVVLLRKFKNMTDPEHIKFYLSLLPILGRSSVPVSEPMPNPKTGEFCTEYDGSFYTVFKFINGTHFFPTLEGLRAVAEGTALLHRALHNLPAGDVARIAFLSRKGRAYYNKITAYTADDFYAIDRNLGGRPTLSPGDVLVRSSMAQFIETIAEVEAEKGAVANLPKQAIHSDLHPHNVIMMGDKLAAILDFDALRISQRAREVAFAAYRFCRQFLVRGEKNPENAGAVLSIFIEAYQKINPLSPEERRLLPILIKDEFLTKLLFVLRGVYEEDNPTWAADLPKFLPAIEEINYLYE